MIWRWLTLLFAIVCFILIIRQYLLNCQIRKLTKQLRDIMTSREAQRYLLLSYPNHELEAFVYEINENINDYYEKQAEYRKNVKEIRSEITSLSHDLRTPLTSILGYVDLIESEGVSEEQKKLLDVIKRRGYQLNGLVEQIYEYARLENREYQWNLELVDIYRVLQEHILCYYTEFEQKGISLELSLPKEKKPILISTDEKCFERVLTNLTSNIIKYSETQARISLKTEGRKCVMTYQSERGNLTDYDIRHIFDRFYKADSARVQTQSSGLGLTITKLFVEQMGGCIYAKGDDIFLYIVCTFPRVG